MRSAPVARSGTGAPVDLSAAIELATVSALPGLALIFRYLLLLGVGSIGTRTPGILVAAVIVVATSPVVLVAGVS